MSSTRRSIVAVRVVLVLLVLLVLVLVVLVLVVLVLVLVLVWHHWLAIPPTLSCRDGPGACCSQCEARGGGRL